MLYEKNMAADAMTIADYKAIYEAIVSLSVDADGYGLFESISNEGAKSGYKFE